MVKRNPAFLILPAILFLALLIRLYPITANMPYLYWHDENNYIESAMRFGSGNFNPMTFSHGGLYQLILFAAYGVFYVLEKIIGLVRSPADFYVNYINDPTLFFVIARAMSAFFGAAAAYLVYVIGSKIYNVRTGLVAAFFAAFSLLMVQTSSLAVADMAAVFILLVSIAILIRSIDNPRDNRLYYASCLLIGLATACKYHMIFGVVSLYVAAFMKSGSSPNPWRNFTRLAVIGSIIAFAGFVVGMPYFIVRFADFYKDTVVRMGGEYIARNPLGNTWLFYFTDHLKNGLGIILESLVVIGILYSLYKRKRWDIFLLSFPIAYYFLFMHSIGHAYHMLPAIPFLFILAARALDELSNRFSGKFSIAIVVCVSVIAIAPTLLEAIKFVRVTAGRDTRTEARAWIEDNVPRNSPVLAEGYLSTVPVHAPPIGENMKTLERDLTETLRLGGSGLFVKTKISNFDRIYGRAACFDVMKVDSLETGDVERSMPEYIVMTSENDKHAGTELAYYIPKEYYEKRKELKDFIAANFEPIRSFLPNDEFTMWFPHLVSDDYRILRNIRLGSMKDYVKGPRIDIFKIKEGNNIAQ